MLESDRVSPSLSLSLSLSRVLRWPRPPSNCTPRGWHGWLLRNAQAPVSGEPFMYCATLPCQIRQRGDSNPCGQSPMDFESISLAARTHCLDILACMRTHWRHAIGWWTHQLGFAPGHDDNQAIPLMQPPPLWPRPRVPSSLRGEILLYSTNSGAWFRSTDLWVMSPTR